MNDIEPGPITQFITDCITSIAKTIGWFLLFALALFMYHSLKMATWEPPPTDRRPACVMCDVQTAEARQGITS